MSLRVRGEKGNHYLAVRAVGRIVFSMEIRVALANCRQPSNLRRTLTIALIVGCILSIINQGDVIVHGDATGATVLKVCLNFVVPNLGVLTGDRTGRA